MKKLFFTLALILSVYALSAQKFEVVDLDGQGIESGATFVVYGDGSASWGFPGGELNTSFIVKALEDVTIMCEKVENNVVTGTSNYLCFGMCLSPDVYIIDYWMSAGAHDELSVHYSASDYLSVAGQEQSMTYYLYERGSEERFAINVIFKYSLEGVNEVPAAVTLSNAYPVPARDVVNFDYNFATNVDAQLAIYNMMGQEVMRNNIDGISGQASINVSDLTDGVYFYSLIVNGKTEKSSKFVVKK